MPRPRPAPAAPLATRPTPAELYAWRSRMGWTAVRAARELDISESQYRLLELGYRYDRDVPVRAKRWLRLACERLEQIERARRVEDLREHAGARARTA